MDVVWRPIRFSGYSILILSASSERPYDSITFIISQYSLARVQYLSIHLVAGE